MSPIIEDIAVSGGSIRAEIAGKGLPLVLLHGWTLNRRCWDAHFELLSRRFQVVAIDRRGFGDSTAPAGLAFEADDLVALQDALALGPMVLVAMSQAGRPALRFAVDFPERLAGLVLQGIPLDELRPPPQSEERIPIDLYAALARRGFLGRVKAMWSAHPLMQVSSDSQRRRVGRLLAHYDGRDLAAAGPAGPGARLEQLGRLDVPALVVTGREETRWRRRTAEAIAETMPMARLKVMAGGHLCSITHARKFSGLIEEFASALGDRRLEVA